MRVDVADNKCTNNEIWMLEVLIEVVYDAIKKIASRVFLKWLFMICWNKRIVSFFVFRANCYDTTPNNEDRDWLCMLCTSWYVVAPPKEFFVPFLSLFAHLCSWQTWFPFSPSGTIVIWINEVSSFEPSLLLTDRAFKSSIGAFANDAVFVVSLLIDCVASSGRDFFKGRWRIGSKYAIATCSKNHDASMGLARSLYCNTSASSYTHWWK